MINLKLITQDDLLDCCCLDACLAVDVVENSIVNFMNGEVIYPEKTVQIFDNVIQSRINILPATLLKEKICGVKWVSVFPNNPNLHNKLNLTAVIILSEIETGYPIAVMEGSLISNLRTAAISAIASKYLSRKNAQTIGFIGAGENAKMNLFTMLHVSPSIKTCFVSSRTEATENKFVSDMSRVFPALEFITCKSNFSQAVVDSDIIVTATSTQQDLLKAKWIKKGAFYSHVGGWEDEYAVPLKASKIVCDDWDSVKHRGQTISRMYKEKILNDHNIYANLGEIVCGGKPGRENDDEFIYFNTVGLSYTDIALAYKMFKLVSDKGLANNVKFQSSGIFDRYSKCI